jgi:beta-glucosidase
MTDANFVDVQALLSQLTLDEKVELLAGQGSFRMTGLERHGIPALIVSLTDDIREKKRRI